MRFLLVGLVLLLSPLRALAQAAGYVESVGIGGAYRPDCWTPMLVNLSSQISEPAEYQIQVIQHDLDQDRQVFTRKITLNPQEQEKFWVYFIPQPSGLDTTSPQTLSRSIEVWLCTAPDSHGNTRQISRLPIRTSIFNVDQVSSSVMSEPMGVKLVVCVSDPQESSNPSFDQYSRSLGLTESLEPVDVHPADLPENVVGYDAVSAIVWFAASSAELNEAGSRRLDALEEYVRGGGRLIVCEPNDVHRLSEFGDLLPVKLRDARGNGLIEVRPGTVDPLMDLATATVESGAGGMSIADRQAAWHRLDGSPDLRLAFAEPKADAVWDEPIHWPDGATSPYIVRRGYGAGSVTWVAQDLGNPALTGRHEPGWAYVWDAIFGWKSTIHPQEDATDSDRAALGSGANAISTDLGAAVLPAMEFPSRGAAYITVAIVFFLVYGVVAGPISYFVLAARKRKDLSWIVFSGCACAATALTLVVVRLALHGEPESHHLSVVRICPGESAQVQSRIGLYVPQGDLQHVELVANASDAMSFITAYPLPPEWFSSTEFPAAQKYDVPVHDPPLQQPVAIDVPIRSTLKKLQARWIGDLPVSIGGSAALLPPGAANHYLSGTLVNNTGVDLANVFIAFTISWDTPPQDWMLYLPRWARGEKIDLTKVIAGAAYLRLAVGMTGAVPGEKSAIKAPISGSAGWAEYFYTRLSGNPLGAPADKYVDADPNEPLSVPILSFFDRLGPSRADKSSGQGRVELLRQGARDFDLSAALEAGKLAIVASADADDPRGSPLPEPITVNGTTVAGEGRVLYQFVLPIDRSKAGMPPPTSKPTSAN